jgi:hypothetical protein
MNLHREWHALAEHRALGHRIEQDHDRSGCRRGEADDLDAIGAEPLAEEASAGVGTEPADQPNRQMSPGEADRDIRPLPARLEPDLGRNVATSRSGRVGTTWTSSRASPTTVIEAVIGR